MPSTARLNGLETAPKSSRIRLTTRSPAPGDTQPSRPPQRLAIMLISAAALAYEVLLMRLFSIIQWHHFAYMIISLALLGYAASGTFLSLFGKRLTDYFHRAFTLNAILFGCSAIGCFLLAQQFPFNTLEMFWNPDQWWYLLGSYLLLFIPFLFAATCVCLSFSRFPEHIPTIYAFDLLGAGIGALGVITLLMLLNPSGVLQVVAATGLAAATLEATADQAGNCRRRTLGLTGILAIVAVILIPAQGLALKPSQYKALSQTLQIPAAQIIDERSSPLGMVSVVKSPQIPLRIAEGLSLNNRTELPTQLGLFVDGESAGALNQFRGNRDALAWLDYQTSALPYHLHPPERVLILGLGGNGVLQAWYHRSPQIEVVEPNKQIADLFQYDFREFTGWGLLKGRVRVHNRDARQFFTTATAGYDLIQISLVDGTSAAASGVYGLNENFLYTREGIALYLSRLNPGGLLAITRWVNLPPRDNIKLLATVIDGLRLTGVHGIDRRLALIRNWNTTTLVVKNGLLNNEEIDRLRIFCEPRSFDLAYYPGVVPGAVNRFNLLPAPYFYQGAQALLSDDAKTFFDHYKFHVQPASDDRPFFFDYFKWSALPEIISLYRLGGVSLLELGYPILVLTLIQALLAGIPLILVPWMFFKSEGLSSDLISLSRATRYFMAIGFGYLFIEIAFIQKFILFLGHPIYSVAVLLGGFLIFSGIGSSQARRILRPGFERQGTLLIAALITLLSLLEPLLMPSLFFRLAELSMPVKILVTLALTAPLAFLMGLPFPLGLAQVAQRASRLIPWIWGINGFASLTGAILATLLAIHIGFDRLLMVAGICYLVAAAAGPGTYPMHPSLSEKRPDLKGAGKRTEV